MRDIDLLVLVRPGQHLDDRVQQAIDGQRGVRLRHYVVVGAPQGAEPRWQTIARARNQAKRLGQSPWVMFLDDDVVLAPLCAERLRDELARRPHCAALAADYLGEGGGLRAEHVAMGATLFRRSALDAIEFRWEPFHCECQCCCDDLRRRGWEIGYWPPARAAHLRPQPAHAAAAADQCFRPTGSADLPAPQPAVALDGRILAAFDGRHYEKFVAQFLGSLYSQGNREGVTAVGYGLSDYQLTWLRRLGVEVLTRAHDGRAVPVRRVEDFQAALEGWPAVTPVAYWDAGDVIIQSRLDELWALVRRYPDKILAVREPTGHPENTAVANWTRSIHDPTARRTAYELLTRRPFLNSGFAAGSAHALRTYFQEAEHLLNSPALQGTSDWGDQTALNLYCHSDPQRWQEIEDVWNYCLFARRKHEVRVDRQGRAVRRDGRLIAAVHGSAGTLSGYPIRHRYG
jgi:hypothetical protein